MSINISYLELRLSGNVENTSASSSLGNKMSNTAIRSKGVTETLSISGITPFDAPGSADGEGTLEYDNVAKTVRWKPYGSSFGSSVDISANGKYAIGGSVNGYVYINVNSASLPGANANGTYAVAQLANQLFDDVSRVESYNGDTEYRCFYVYNTHPTDSFIGVKCYVGSQPNGADTIDIGLDPAGIGDGVNSGVAQQVVNENSSPGSVAFSRPSVIGSALNLGELQAGQARPVWQRRAVPAQTYTPTLVDVSSLIFNVGY